MLNKEKEVIFESDDVTEVIDKVKDYLVNAKGIWLTITSKVVWILNILFAKIEIVRLDNMGDFCITNIKSLKNQNLSENEE